MAYRPGQLVLTNGTLIRNHTGVLKLCKIIKLRLIYQHTNHKPFGCEKSVSPHKVMCLSVFTLFRNHTSVELKSVFSLSTHTLENIQMWIFVLSYQAVFYHPTHWYKTIYVWGICVISSGSNHQHTHEKPYTCEKFVFF